jgi:hypothetical protein
MFSTFRKAAALVFVGAAFSSAVAASLALHAALALIGSVSPAGAPRAEG